MDERKKQLYGSWSVTLAALLFSCEPVGSKLAYANGYSVMSLASLRYVVAALAFIAVACCRRIPLFVPKPCRWPLLRVGLVGSCSSGLLYLGYDLLPATFATLFFFSYPAFTSLVSVLFFHGRLNAVKVVSLVVSACGLVLLYWSAARFLTLPGVLCGIGAALLQGVKLNMADNLLERVDLTVYTLGIVLIMCLFFNSVTLIGGGYSLSGVSLRGWLIMLFLAAAVTFGGNFSQYNGVDKIGAVDTSLIMLLQPPLTALLAWLLLGDLLRGWQIAGALLILFAVALPPLQQRRAQRRRTL